MRIGYVVKRYPRYSETFIVNEILAHERSQLKIDIFALRPPCDSHFQNCLAQVRAAVTYLQKPQQGRVSESLNSLSPTAASYFWAELQELGKIIPEFWEKLAFAQGEKASTVYQGVWLAREVHLRGITHLHAHFASVATSVTRLAAHFADIPYSFTAHAKDIFHESVDFDDMTRKIRDAARVVTVSDYNQYYLQQTYGKVAQKLQRIYNGLDLSQLNYQSPENRPMHIISVGRLVEKKGIIYLIKACALLKQWGCHFQCTIVGSGELEQELKQQINQLKLQSLVRIIGSRPQNEVFELIQKSSVFVAPYIIGKDGNRDGLPTVLLEAMALGTPCIATDVTGIPEMIKDHETGLIVPQENSEALAIAIKTLLTDPSLGVKLSKKARRLMESQFDINQNTETLRQLFQPKIQLKVAS